MRLSKMAGIFAGSMGVASAIIGASLLTLVGVYLVASGLNGWFLSLGFGVFAVSLVRMADILPRMRKEGTLGDRQIVPKAIIHSLKTPVMIGLALLFLVPSVGPFYFYGYPARVTLYDASFFLSVVVAITIAGRMRRRFW